MVKQLTKEEAVASYDSVKHVGQHLLTAREIVEFQLYQELLCVPWNVFHKAIEEVLGRPVWTHEFARPDVLRAEFEGKKPKGTVWESVNMLVELAGDKPIIAVTTGGKEE